MKLYPSVGDVVCHCSRHSTGCGCLNDKFIERARNNFCFILSMSESAEEFATKLRALARHACDEHEWDGGRCDFQMPRVCSCGKCEKLQCKGKDYHIKFMLSCPFHSLAYEIECNERAEMAQVLVHSTVKRGHSNWLEASHNVFIRFRPKHINLERLHYVVSTELVLLQSNMTYLNEKRGPQYHWVIELFRLLKLPVFDGVHASLEAFNKQSKAELNRKKTDRCKRRWTELKAERTLDAQRCKKWSKKHGHDTYGSGDSDKEGVELKPKDPKGSKHQVGGSVRRVDPPHLQSNHRDCPFNKRIRETNASTNLENEGASESSDVIHHSEEDLSDGFFSESSVASSKSDLGFEDDIIRMSACTCMCGTLCRAH